MKPYTTPQTAVLGALRAFIPATLGIIPFGLVFGVSATEIGISPIEGIGMSTIMFAGAAQLAVVELLKVNAAAWVVILSALVINLRFVIYSASLTPHFKSLPLSRKLIAGYLITDQPYAMAIAYFNEYPDAPHKFWYYMGHGIGLWITWVTSSAVGLLIGSVIPQSWSLGLVIPLMFIGLVVPAIKGKSFLVAAMVSGASAVLFQSIPNNLGLMIAIFLGIMAGVIVEKFD